jgi:archaemetzincin
MRKGKVKTAVLFSAALGLAALHVQASEAPVAADDADFVKLGSPQPGEWRDVFPEPVQTFEEYTERTARLHAGGPRITVVTFSGETQTFDEESLELLAGFIEAYFFGACLKLQPARELPDTVTRRPSRGFGMQVLADDVLQVMVQNVAREWSDILQAYFGSTKSPRSGDWAFADALLGIVQTDLYGSSPDGGYLNFVFGMGAYANMVAVISPARYSIRYGGEPEGITLRKRFFKVAAHEIGHVFGLAHCQTYACCMNGSNLLPEADRRPIHLCPECLEKLEHHLGFDRGLRYRKLAPIYRKLGWEKEAEFAARRAMPDPGPLAPGGKDVRGTASKGTE